MEGGASFIYGVHCRGGRHCGGHALSQVAGVFVDVDHCSWQAFRGMFRANIRPDEHT